MNNRCDMHSVYHRRWIEITSLPWHKIIMIWLIWWSQLLMHISCITYILQMDVYCMLYAVRAYISNSGSIYKPTTTMHWMFMRTTSHVIGDSFRLLNLHARNPACDNGIFFLIPLRRILSVWREKLRADQKRLSWNKEEKKNHLTHFDNCCTSYSSSYWACILLMAWPI